MTDYSEEVDPESELNQKLEQIEDVLEGRKRIVPHVEEFVTTQYSKSIKLRRRGDFKDHYFHVFAEVCEAVNRLDFDVYVSFISKTDYDGIKISLKPDK